MRQLNHLAHSPLQAITDEHTQAAEIKLFIKRDDLLHPLLCGNKYRKLKYNLQHAALSKASHVVSFGGAFSNHIHALASAGRIFQFSTVGFIRGPQLDLQNPTLRFAKACGMQLQALTREQYRQRHQPEFLAELQSRYPQALFIPEGGSNLHALPGCAEILQEVLDEVPADVIVTPVGSAGTLAGLVSHPNPHCLRLGIAVLKQADYLRQHISAWLPEPPSPWRLLTEYHQGGYGKVNPALLEFCAKMELRHQLPLEPIYSGKMLMAVYQLMAEGYFRKGSTVVALHTGGLQGIHGLRYRNLIAG